MTARALTLLGWVLLLAGCSLHQPQAIAPAT